MRCQDGYDDCHGMHGNDYHAVLARPALVAHVADAIIALGPDTSREDAIDLAEKLLDLVPWLADAATDYARSTDRDWDQTTFWGAVQAAFEEADPIDIPRRAEAPTEETEAK